MLNIVSMRNVTSFVSKHPIAASMGYLFCALSGYAMLAAVLVHLKDWQGHWIVPFSIHFSMLLLLLSTSLVIPIAVAFKTHKILGPRVAKQGYLIVLAFIGTYQIAGFLTHQLFLFVSKMFGLR